MKSLAEHIINIERLEQVQGLFGNMDENIFDKDTVFDKIQEVDLKERMEKAVQEKEGGVVHVEMEVDPKIIGGFIFEMDGKRMDASVEGRIARIRRHLVEKNNRIV